MFDFDGLYKFIFVTGAISALVGSLAIYGLYKLII